MRRIPREHRCASAGTRRALGDIEQRAAVPETVACRVTRYGRTTLRQRAASRKPRMRRDLAPCRRHLTHRGLRQARRRCRRAPRARAPDRRAQRDAERPAVAEEVARGLARLRAEHADDLLGERAQHRGRVQPPEARLHARYPETAMAAAIAAARAGSRTTRRNGSCCFAHPSAAATSSGCCSMKAVL